MNWTIDQLKSELASREIIKGWVLSQEHIRRRERYFLADHKKLAVDQDRSSDSASTVMRIFVKLPAAGRQGELRKKLFTALPLRDQVDRAIEAALQTDHQAWELPKEVLENLPARLSTDARIAEDLEGTMNELTRQVSFAVLKERKSVFNSAELFLSLHDQEVHLSNGLVHRSSQSRAYLEAAFSVSQEEYLNTAWSVDLDDLSVEKLFDEAAERAERSSQVEKPISGNYPVLVDADVLSQLFSARLSHLSATHSYHRMPFLSVGEEFVAGAEGDLVTVRLDPTIPKCADTVALSNDGVIQNPLEVVHKNQVVAMTSDKQYADYLQTRPTTSRGNIVVEPGTLSSDELRKLGSKVIEILQFSAFFVDATSCTYSSEIRLAKLYDNQSGQVTFIKGGSLSGSITENFKRLKLSRETVKRSHFAPDHSHGVGYFGPAFALLSDVSIVG